MDLESMPEIVNTAIILGGLTLGYTAGVILIRYENLRIARSYYEMGLEKEKPTFWNIGRLNSNKIETIQKYIKNRMESAEEGSNNSQDSQNS
jgi:hypothetical protein